MEALNTLLIGWILGLVSALFSPLIIDWMKEPFKARSLVRAIQSEVCEVRYRLSLYAYLLKTGYEEPDKEFLRWVIRKGDEYEGPENKAHLEALKKIERVEGPEFDKLWGLHKAKDGVGRSLKTFPTGFIDANFQRLGILPKNFQAQLHLFRNKISTLNQQIVSVTEKQKMTFDSSISDDNHRRIEEQIISDYKEIATQCRLTSDILDHLITNKPSVWW